MKNGGFQVPILELPIARSNLDLSLVDDVDFQEKMKKFIRNLFIEKVPKAVLELFKNKEHGRGFRDAILNENWLEGLKEKRKWFEEVVHNKKWYNRALKNNKWMKYESPDFLNLFGLLSGIFLKGFNGSGEGSAAKNYKDLSLLIGNRRFSESDDVNKIKEMDSQEFCQKIASSVLAKFLDERTPFFKTWAEHVYEPKTNLHLQKYQENVLNDDQKRLMYIACKAYIRERFAHPENFIDEKKSKNKQNKSDQTSKSSCLEVQQL